MQPGPIALEPMGVGDMLDAGFRMWRRDFLKFFLIVLAAIVPVQLVAMVYNFATISTISDGTATYSTSGVLGALAVAIIGWIGQAIGYGAAWTVATRSFVGIDVDWVVALRYGVRRMLPFFGLVILYFLAVMVGLIGLIIGSIFVAVWLSLAAPAFWAEEVGVIKALSRGNQLISGRYWSVFGVAIVAFLISLVLSLVITLPFTPVLSTDSIAVFSMGTALLSIVSGAVTFPIVPIFTTVAYYDGRIRKEGLDVQLLAQSVEEPRPYPEA